MLWQIIEKINDVFCCVFPLWIVIIQDKGNKITKQEGACLKSADEIHSQCDSGSFLHFIRMYSQYIHSKHS